MYIKFNFIEKSSKNGKDGRLA